DPRVKKAEFGLSVTGQPPRGLQFLHSFRQLALPEITHCDGRMRTSPIWIDGEQSLQKLNTGVRVVAHAERKPHSGVDDGRERVERLCALLLSDCLDAAPLRFEKDTEPLVRCGIIWIQFDGTAEFCFRYGPIPILSMDGAQCSMRFSQSPIQLDGFQRRG